jgi:hypothetical protein
MYKNISFSPYFFFQTASVVYLSGNTTCHWYFNPTIPEAQPFYDKYELTNDH